MSTTTIRACDKCGDHVAEDAPLYTLAIIGKKNASVGIPFEQQFNQSVRTSLNKVNILEVNYTQDYCETCLKSSGLRLRDEDAIAKQEAKLTFDDLLHEIVDDAVTDRFNEGP